MTYNNSPPDDQLPHPIELIQITRYDRLNMVKVDVWNQQHRHCDGYPADGTGLAESWDAALEDAVVDLLKRTFKHRNVG